MEPLERHDMQGLILTSFADWSCAAYVLLRITDPAAARERLARFADEITTAEGTTGDVGFNVALTYTGLERLGLAAPTLDTFSQAFRDGVASERRSRILGDVGESAPASWRWGNAANPVDVLLMLFATDEATRDKHLGPRREEAQRAGLEVVTTIVAGRQRVDNKEHFGFVDGIGQPVIEGSGREQRQRGRTGHATVLKPGEFILGYLDDYGKPAPSPTVEPAGDPSQILPEVERPETGKRVRDLGRNGSYLVFRQIEQHVGEFWRFLDEATRNPDGTSNPGERVRLGAKFVGRWPSGAPLVKAPTSDPHPDGGTTNDNDFEFFERDPHGFACPIGSHIRRSNPRDSLGPDPETALVSARRHRLLRRGRSYGETATDPLVDDGVERGLLFICLNGDIERQFEFVQQTWCNNPVFGGLYHEQDPIIGNQGRADGVTTIQAEPVRSRVHGLHRFVTTRGGAYFFLPGIRALRYLGSLAG